MPPIDKAAGIIATLAVIALLAYGAAHADTVYVHGVSEHYVECDTPCNEVNPGISYKRDMGDNFIHVGAFENSQSNPAAFGAYGWSRHWNGIELGASVGAAVGYVDSSGVTEAGLLPFVSVSAEYGPVYAAVIPGAVTLAVRVPLSE